MIQLSNKKDPEKLIVFTIESLTPLSSEEIKEISEYLNNDTSYTIKILPISSTHYDKPGIKCIYPVIPNDDILSLLDKVVDIDGEVGREAKSILRMLKIQKIND